LSAVSCWAVGARAGRLLDPDAEPVYERMIGALDRV
jgi:hypothetical protein